jgi:hypothetical protein
MSPYIKHIRFVFKGLIDHLTGFDRAGPLFKDQSCKVHFCKGDAKFTEAIHTNGNPLWGLGTSSEDGGNMTPWG